MARLKDIAAFLDERLEIAKYRSDASNNGLQFEAGPEVRKALADSNVEPAGFHHLTI